VRKKGYHVPLSPLSLWERVGVREKRRYVSKILWFKRKAL